jgi:hypothetical protein
VSQGKLIYIFVAGVEGVGHHGLHPVLETAFRNSAQLKQSNGEVISYKKRMKRGFNQIWCHVHPPGFGFLRGFFRWYLDYFFRKEKQKALEGGQLRVIIEDNSFPAGRYRNLDRQWKLDEMEKIVAPHADEIYYIGLYRDPVAAIFSHQRFDGGLYPHAEKIRGALEYLNNELAKVDEKRLRIAHYEDLVGNQEALGAMLSEYLGLEESALKEGFAKVRPSKKNWQRDMPAADQEKLKAMFSEEKARQFWPRFLTPSRAGH